MRKVRIGRRATTHLTFLLKSEADLTLGTDCANKVKKKRPIMKTVLDFFIQCKQRDRVRRLSVESCKRSNSSSSDCPLPDSSDLKTPLELQLWYDMLKEGTPSPESTVCPTFGSEAKTHVTDHSRFETDSSIASTLNTRTDSTSIYEDGDQSIPTIDPDAAAVIPLITELGLSDTHNDNPTK